ncbi:MAG: sugar phosphate nucleotidyltransferase [Verrucomicrobiota bacterium]
MDLLVLAAGMGSRYGGLKQLDPMGPNGEAVLDYSVYDAMRAGFSRIVFIIRRDFEHQFRSSVGQHFSSKIPVEYAYQELTDVPEKIALPAGRTKPWGTGHAVYVARDIVDQPFAVINADDFYGFDAFKQLAEALKKREASATEGDYAMVGYRLENTLSDHGSVARGLCLCDDGNRLKSVTEIVGIERTSSQPSYTNDEGETVSLAPGSVVSMNFWGFTPEIFDHLEHLFARFLEQNRDSEKAEFYIPSAVDDLIRENRAQAEVLTTESTWFGVTYQEDRAHVVQSIEALIGGKSYPAKLWGPNGA